MANDNNTPKKKALGAAKQIASTLEKDLAREAALAEGLEHDHIFISAARAIDAKRKQLIRDAKKDFAGILIPSTPAILEKESFWKRFKRIFSKDKAGKIYIEARPGYPAWKTIRNFFKQKAEEFGYKGDKDDWEELERWAETLVARSLQASRKIPGLIRKGRLISLERKSDAFVIRVRRARKNLTKR